MTDEPKCESHRRLHAVPRGLLRLVIARLLETRELSGIEIINTLEERSNGTWRPSPGSIYPLLAQMEENGYIETVRVEGRSKTYQLTDEGRILLTRIRGHKKILLKKMQIGPLFWLGILDPMDQALAYIDMATIALERLHLINSGLTTRQRQRIVKRLNELLRNLQKITEESNQGGSTK